MAIYSYKGLDRKGEDKLGVLDGESEREVISVLREQGIFVLKVREGEVLDEQNPIVFFIKSYLVLLLPHHHIPVGTIDLVNFFRQVALMLRAGYTLVTALDACQGMVSKHKLRRALVRMSDEIRKGATFSTMLAKEKKLFSPVVAKLVASGEQSGNLDNILERLAENMEKSKELKRQITSALVYPTFVMCSSVGVVIFLVIGVIPRFARFLTARNAELPASTQLLLDISSWTLTYGAIVLGVVVFTVFFTLVAYTTIPGKRIVDRCILAIPIIGSAIQYGGMAQAGWCLSMLLKSGVTVLEALRITTGVLGNLALSDCFARASNEILEGKALSKSFNQRHITMMMQHMAAVGESSGQLDTVMHSIGEYYQKELSAKVKLIASMIEPSLIIGVGGMVGFVYYAFFQAVMSVSKGGM